MAFCFRLSHALFELQTRKKLEKLTENAAESIHGRILLVGVFAFTNLMRWIRHLFQIPNLDQSAYGTTNTQLENESSVAVHTFSVYQLFWDSESFDLLDQDAVEVNSYKIATENLLAKRAGAGRDD